MVESKLKIEIRDLDGSWQWMGKLTQKQLDVLLALADKLSDMDDED